MRSGFSNLDGGFNRDIILSLSGNPTKYSLKVVCSFIRFEDKLQRQQDRKATKEQPRFGSSKAVSVGTDLAGLRRTDPRRL